MTAVEIKNAILGWAAWNATATQVQASGAVRSVTKGGAGIYLVTLNDPQIWDAGNPAANTIAVLANCYLGGNVTMHATGLTGNELAVVGADVANVPTDLPGAVFLFSVPRTN